MVVLGVVEVVVVVVVVVIVVVAAAAAAVVVLIIIIIIFNQRLKICTKLDPESQKYSPYPTPLRAVTYP